MRATLIKMGRIDPLYSKNTCVGNKQTFYERFLSPDFEKFENFGDFLFLKRLSKI